MNNSIKSNQKSVIDINSTNGKDNVDIINLVNFHNDAGKLDWWYDKCMNASFQFQREKSTSALLTISDWAKDSIEIVWKSMWKPSGRKKLIQTLHNVVTPQHFGRNWIMLNGKLVPHRSTQWEQQNGFVLMDVSNDTSLTNQVAMCNGRTNSNSVTNHAESCVSVCELAKWNKRWRGLLCRRSRRECINRSQCKFVKSWNIADSFYLINPLKFSSQVARNEDRDSLPINWNYGMNGLRQTALYLANPYLLAKSEVIFVDFYAMPDDLAHDLLYNVRRHGQRVVYPGNKYLEQSVPVKDSSNDMVFTFMKKYSKGACLYQNLFTEIQSDDFMSLSYNGSTLMGGCSFFNINFINAALGMSSCPISRYIADIVRFVLGGIKNAPLILNRKLNTLFDKYTVSWVRVSGQNDQSDVATLIIFDHEFKIGWIFMFDHLKGWIYWVDVSSLMYLVYNRFNLSMFMYKRFDLYVKFINVFMAYRNCKSKDEHWSEILVWLRQNIKHRKEEL